MRLKAVWISEYKNLKNFKLDLDGTSFLDIFVGKNGSGKSNLLEAIVEIFKFLFEYKSEQKTVIGFDFKILINLNDNDVLFEGTSGRVKVNNTPVEEVDTALLPDKVIQYYSGHNEGLKDIIGKYDFAFKGKIQAVELDDFRSIVSIGRDYKDILLSVILLHNDDNKSKNYIKEKLGIEQVGPFLKLVLKKPFNARRDIKNGFGPNSFWKTKGILRTFINGLLDSSHKDVSGRIRTEGYSLADKRYILYVDIEKLKAKFNEFRPLDYFSYFDNLKTLGMLESVSIPLTLKNNVEATTAYFSDGQFQSVYMYSIVEIFKGLNCLTLLDEPDSFLHPEWQFLFIDQINDIAEDTTKKNHIILSTHSASTVAKADASTIRLFDFVGTEVKTSQASKSDVVKSLSAGLLTYSEGENLLRLSNAIQLNDKIIFVEGPSDVAILETAYKALYPRERVPFFALDVMGFGMIKIFLGRDELFNKFPDKFFIGLYDFDKAIKDWKDFAWDFSFTDLSSGLGKKRADRRAYAFLLPVPDKAIRGQVWDNNHPVDKILPNPHYCIEHIFYDVHEANAYFKTEDGKSHFKGDKHKIKFAQEVVPTFPATAFEPLRPFFDTIRGL